MSRPLWFKPPFQHIQHISIVSHPDIARAASLVLLIWFSGIWIECTDINWLAWMWSMKMNATLWRNQYYQPHCEILWRAFQHTFINVYIRLHPYVLICDVYVHLFAVISLEKSILSSNMYVTVESTVSNDTADVKWKSMKISIDSCDWVPIDGRFFSLAILELNHTVYYLSDTIMRPYLSQATKNDWCWNQRW